MVWEEPTLPGVDGETIIPSPTSEGQLVQLSYTLTVRLLRVIIAYGTDDRVWPRKERDRIFRDMLTEVLLQLKGPQRD